MPVRSLLEPASRGHLAGDPARYINLLLLLRLAAETTATVLVTVAFVQVFDTPWVGALVAAGAMVLVSYVFIGVGPRTLGRQHPYRIGMLLATPVPGYIACCEALSTLDQRELLPEIKSPTLVIAGRHDMATPIAAGEFIRSKIPGASLTILDAAHISNVEQSHAFTDAVVGFLTQK